MGKKFELTTDSKVVFGRKLFRIRALVAFGDVEAGSIGGFVEKEENLSQYGDAWVYGNAQVSGNARVSGNAQVCGEYDHILIGPIGSRNDYTSFNRSKDGTINVVCGCFQGNLDEFEKAVKNTHGDNKHAKAYLAAIQFARSVINTEAVEDK